MTKQEIFDRALAALRKQTRRSGKTDDQGRWICTYRDSDGNRCAVGHLMSEEDFGNIERKNLMGSPINSLLGVLSGQLSHLSPSDISADADHAYSAVKFLNHLQRSLHDFCSDTKNADLLDHKQVEENAEAFATTWGLRYSPPELNQQGDAP